MFKYALCNELFAELPMAEAFDLVAELGYTGIEIAPFTLVNDAPLSDLRAIDYGCRKTCVKKAAEAGLEVVGLHWLLAKTEGLHLTSPELDCRKRTSAFLAELAQLCADLGGRILVLGSPQQRRRHTGVSTEAAFTYAVDVLQMAMPRYEQLGVTMALEPLARSETNFLNTAAEAVRLAERVDSSSCRLLLDVKGMSDESTPIPQLIRNYHQWLVHFHANDRNLLGPGMGDIDFKPILESLAATGYDGWVSVEVFRDEPTPYEVARQSIEYLQRMERSVDRS